MEYKDFNFEIDTKTITEEGTFEGYASTFGGAPDSGGDVIHRGSFLETLEKGGINGTGIPMLWQHDTRNPIGKFPALGENNKGLKVQGKLTLGVNQAKEAHELLKDDVIKSMSIGFDAIEKEHDKNGIRHIKKVNLWEISLVTFPMNARANITTIKAAKNEREFEKALREAGLSWDTCKWLVSNCKDSLREVWNQENEELNPILDSLKTVNQSFGIKSMLSEIERVNKNLIKV